MPGAVGWAATWAAKMQTHIPHAGSITRSKDVGTHARSDHAAIAALARLEPIFSEQEQHPEEVTQSAGQEFRLK